MADGDPFKVIWHDLECHGDDDLALWAELAAEAPGRILEVGAGTGRVSLALARGGHEIVALELDGDLLAALRSRAEQEGLRVGLVQAPAEEMELPEAYFGLVLVPCQTIQLIADRPRFLRRARTALQPGGLLAAAVIEDDETYEQRPYRSVADAEREPGAWSFAAHPVQRKVQDGRRHRHYVREALTPEGTLYREEFQMSLAVLTPGELEAEGAAAGFTVEPRREIAPSDAGYGAIVVVLRA